jgi:hypothetical protein
MLSRIIGAKRMTKLEKTAYHEAGHAVANFHLGLAIKEISIIENEEELGHCDGSSWGITISGTCTIHEEVDNERFNIMLVEKHALINLIF